MGGIGPPGGMPMPGGIPGKPPLGKAPVLPGSPMGGPAGPGATSMTAPGAGAGNEAAADAQIKASLPTLHKALAAYPVGSKKYAAVLNALRALTANFGKSDTESIVPAAIQQMMMNAKGPGAGAPPMPPPGLKPAGLAPAPGLGGGGDEGEM